MKTWQILEMIEEKHFMEAIKAIGALTAEECNAPVNNGNALVLHLARSGNADLIRALVIKGIDLEQRWKNPSDLNNNSVKSSAPEGALSQDDINALLGDISGSEPAGKEIITQNDINNLIEAIGQEPDRDEVFVDYTALDICQWECFEEATLALVEAGADCNRANPHGYYPLGRAVLNEWYDVVQAMLLHGANPDIMDSSGQTIWHMSAGIMNPRLLKMAVESGCDPDRARNDGILPLQIAASSGNVPCIASLLAAGADLFKRSKGLDTPLGIAVMNDQTEAVKILEKNAGLDSYTDSSHNTLLHYAAWKGQEKFCRYLLDHGQKVDAINDLHDTPLGHAALNGHIKVCILLLDRGANPSHTRRKGQDIVVMARAREHNEIVALLLERIEKSGNDGSDIPEFTDN